MSLSSGVERRPEAPGPGPVPEALLRSLELSVRRRAQGLMPGEVRSHQLGSGTELALVRPYRPGDDVRRIDWNVTARTGEPHVRVDVAERTLTTWLVLDRSPSMAFGTADRRKADVAEGVALALGHLSTRRGNRLGIVTFGGDADAVMAPRSGPRGMLAALRESRRGPAAGPVGTTSLREAVLRVGRVARGRSLVVLVADFRGESGWDRALADLGGRHDVLAIEIRDRHEDELPDIGSVWLSDPETGEELQVDTGDARVRSAFADAAAEDRRLLARRLARCGADHVVLTTAGDWLRPLADAVKVRGRAR